MKTGSKEKPSEINELTQEMRAGFTELRTGFENGQKETDNLRQEMRAGFTGMHQQMQELTKQTQEMRTGLTLVQADLTGVRKEMHISLAEVRTGLTDTQHEMREKFAESMQYTQALRYETEMMFKDVLDTMNDHATHTDSEISGLKADVGSLKADMQYVKGVINTQMPTKGYIDAKLFKLSGEIGGSMNKEDDKVNALTGILTEKKVLTKSEAKKIAQIGPSFMKV